MVCEERPVGQVFRILYGLIGEYKYEKQDRTAVETE